MPSKSDELDTHLDQNQYLMRLRLVNVQQDVTGDCLLCRVLNLERAREVLARFWRATASS